MSDTTTSPALGETITTSAQDDAPGRNWVKVGLLLLALVAMMAVPLYVEAFWLRLGFAAFGAIIGAIGLNLLVGNTGQLSLAHAFFLAVGAITYVYVAGEPAERAESIDGLGLPPLLGMVLGVLLAGLAGLLFSPIAARLRGIYLGVASLGLVFIGQHVLNTWTSVTGGFNGRSAPGFELFGFSISTSEDYLAVLGVPYGGAERLWYLGLFLAIGAYWFAKNLLNSRPGRAFMTLRDSEVAASVMGVDVQRYKARVFLVSSMYAGLSGVLYALYIGSVAPESFALDLSILYLAMIVLGGLGSVGGAALGAVFVSSLPIVFQEYAGSLPLVSEAGQGGVSAGQAARLLFGLAIVVIVLYEPAGIVGFADRFRRRGRRKHRPIDSTSETTPSSTPAQGSTS